MPVHELLGERFGRLTVIARAPSNARGRAMWACHCDCGTDCVVLGNSLLVGHTHSCGCWQRSVSYKHGGYRTPEYMAWCAMKSRCFAKSHARYDRYGGRGITVCERWLHSFENFLADMGTKPTPGHSLDRIDCDGDYCPDNCRWATREAQDNNRTNTTPITWDGRTLTLGQWARELGFSRNALAHRLEAGLPIGEVLSRPHLVGHPLLP